jgi:hypothetical protein
LAAERVDILLSLKDEDYSIFECRQETVRIFRFAEDAEEPVAVQSFDDTLTTPLLPGFRF